MTAVRDGLTIRSAQTRDLKSVVEIYNAGIAERVATFETAPRTTGDVTSWVEDGQPFIVATSDNEVVGWARAGAYSDRCVYHGVGEHAVYVHPNARGRGLGRTLLIELCAEAERRGLYKLTSRVFTDNEPSRAAHRAAGFEEVGIQRCHGKLDGQWKDCVVVERLLGPAADRLRRERLGVAFEVGSGLVTEIQLNDPQTLYRRWEESHWSPFAIDLSRDVAQ